MIVNPTTISFDHADFAGTDSYSIGYFNHPTDATPVQESPVPKPPAMPCTVPLANQPLAFQTWYVAVRAIAGGGSSVWSTPLVPFQRAPSAPTGVSLG